VQHVSTQTKPLAVSKQLEMENPDPASTQFWKVAAEKLNNKASCNEEAWQLHSASTPHHGQCGGEPRRHCKDSEVSRRARESEPSPSPRSLQL